MRAATSKSAIEMIDWLFTVDTLNTSSVHWPATPSVRARANGKLSLYHIGRFALCEILVIRYQNQAFVGLCTSICGKGIVIPASSNLSFTASMVSQETAQ